MTSISALFVQVGASFALSIYEFSFSKNEFSFPKNFPKTSFFRGNLALINKYLAHVGLRQLHH
jgi:hypothetical protein